ncbi:MAG TPA: YdeI/OmpD-associated family protein [Solirubrobacteraceae bacterium]
MIEFEELDAWQRWLHAQHAASAGVWVKLARKSSATATVTVTYAEAVEEALCYGWIDAQKAPGDESFWLQRFTPRSPRSKWSEINRRKATELIERGRMRPAGLAEVEAARQDGRWDAAYASPRTATVPEDFQRALDDNPAANDFFATLGSTHRYSFLYRIADAKRPETRARRIREYVEMLAEGRTIHR